MTVHEMEDITGLTRANIRFYETQGFISPERLGNRYRAYSAEDAQILLRVKLLRALGMSLEQIRALQTGQDHMVTALDRQIQALAAQQVQLGNSQRVCQEMRQDGVQFETLDARHYLNSLENPVQKPSEIVARDVQPRVFAPWQRFWARALDGTAYSLVLMVVATWLADGRMPQWGSLTSTILGFAMMLALEPLQLRLLGTTLGKWIFGIQVTDNEGNRLSLSEGFGRTWRVIVFGEGLDIPGVALWRNWKSYKSYDNGEYLPWEEQSELTVKDKEPLRYLAAVAVVAVLFGASVGLTVLSQVPENRGDLTVAQFCENYRKIASQQGMDTERFVLRDDGVWYAAPFNGTAYIDLSVNSKPLDLVFTTQNGVVTSVTISEELVGAQDGVIGARIVQRQLVAMSLLMAQPDYSVFRGQEKAILTKIQETPFEDFDLTVCGLRFTCDVEVSGYWNADTMLLEDEDPDTESYYAMTFTVTKTG